MTRGTDPDRFEIAVDGQPVGFTQFRDRDGQRIFDHTEIDPAFGGRGLAAAVVRTALESTRDQGLRIVPVCPYVVRFVAEHPEFDPVVDRPDAG